MSKLEQSLMQIRQLEETLESKCAQCEILHKLLSFSLDYCDLGNIIKQTFAEVGQYLGADKISLYAYSSDGTRADLQFEWKKPHYLINPAVFQYEILENIGCLVVKYNKQLNKMNGDNNWFLSRITEFISNLILRYEQDEKRKRAKQRIESLAYTDRLTGLPNRFKLDNDLTEILASQKANGYLIILDLDDFKNMNDAFGHPFGDKMLMSVAEFLKQISRDGMHPYKFSGDEFAVICDKFDINAVKQVSQEIKDKFSNTWTIDDMDLFCTCSLGIVCFEAVGCTSESVIRNADSALSLAKASGKNRVEFFTKDSETKAIDRIKLEVHLRNAIADECRQFRLYYQPILDLQSKRITSVEALIRWFEPTLGFIQPNDFIPLCEYLGLIIPLGEWVVNNACEYIKKLNDSGFDDLKVNINMSVLQMKHKDITTMIATAIKRSGVNPKNIVFEVTESIAIGNITGMINTLTELKSYGPILAMDDFGMGYSTLVNLLNLPIDIIKIDKSFVFNLRYSDKKAVSYIRAVADLARNTGRQTCVEGVETYEQYMLLKDLNIDSAQGYLFSKPITTVELETFLFKNMKK